MKKEFTRTNKTQYLESSLIIAGLPPKLGRIDVIIKDTKQFTKKPFPVWIFLE